MSVMYLPVMAPPYEAAADGWIVVSQAIRRGWLSSREEHAFEGMPPRPALDEKMHQVSSDGPDAASGANPYRYFGSVLCASASPSRSSSGNERFNPTLAGAINVRR